MQIYARLAIGLDMLVLSLSGCLCDLQSVLWLYYDYIIGVPSLILFYKTFKICICAAKASTIKHLRFERILKSPSTCYLFYKLKNKNKNKE